MTQRNDGGPAFPVQDPQAIHAYAMAASVDIKDSAEQESVYTKARAEAVGGMSLRDYFAAQAMQGLIGGATGWSQCDYKPVGGLSIIENGALLAYKYADAMLAARERT